MTIPREFVVRSDEATRIDVAPRRSVKVGIGFPAGDFEVAPGEIAVVCRDATGQVAWEQTLYLHDGLQHEGTYYTFLRVPPASHYDVELTTAAGLRATLTLEAEDLEGDPRQRMPHLVRMR